MATIYGLGPYGAGTYGPTQRIEPDPLPIPERLWRPMPADHRLGIGPWAESVQWRAAPNYGLTATRRYPALPILGVPHRQASFTLRRTEASDARIELDLPRGSAIVIEEMITDLWWWRADPTRGTVDPIGRFNADAVDVSVEGDRTRVSATFTDYRGVLEDRLVFANSPIPSGHAAGTSVNTILWTIFPENAGIDLAALNTVDLGTIDPTLEYTIGTPVGDVVRALHDISPAFDWAVDMADNPQGRPVLRLWPGSRGTNRGVVLADLGDAPSPIAGWSRQTNREDYANAIYLSGREFGAHAVLDVTDLPTGQRDGTAERPNLITQSLIEKAAREELARRSVPRASWSVRLARGVWEGRDHIDLGDPVRIIVRLGDEVIDDTQPVEEITVEVDSSGAEDVTLTLGRARPSTNLRSRQSAIGKIVKQLKKTGRKPPFPSS